MLVSNLNSSGPANANDFGLYGYGAEGIISVASIKVFSNYVSYHSDVYTHYIKQVRVLITTSIF